jgi:hypothetical protein
MTDKKAKAKAPAKEKTQGEKMQEVIDSLDPNQPMNKADIYRILVQIADALK